MKSSRPMILTSLSFATGFLLLASNVAIADEQPPAPPSAPIEAQSTHSSMTNMPSTSISDGQLLQFPELKMNILPLQGWEVRTGTSGLTLVMQEPTASAHKINNEEIKFQRNMTVVSRHKPTPIDAQSIDEFRNELNEKMAKDVMVSGFQIVEAKFFNYRSTNDAILIYSTMKLGAAQVMQAHVRISGAQNNFWVTYTDLADRFSADQDTFKKVWNVIASINVDGVPARRYMDLIVYGSAAAGALILFGIIGFIRRRRAGSMYENLANEVYDDEGDIRTSTSTTSEMTQSDVWALTATSKVAVATSHNKPRKAKSDTQEEMSWGNEVSSVSNFI